MITKEFLLKGLKSEISDKLKQGYDVKDLAEKLEIEKDIDYNKIFDYADKIKNSKSSKNWPYIEPDNYNEILLQCDNSRKTEVIKKLSEEEINKKVESGFIASVCGCILGKPVEQAPYGTLWDIKNAAKKVNEWPIKYYFSEAFLDAWGRRNPSWTETTKNNISFVAPDDDITYSICGMLLLENHGKSFTHKDIAQLWIENLPIYTCWGPERSILLKAGLASIFPDVKTDLNTWADTFNGGKELCGGLIRVDAYGYACPGNPELASSLAYKDVSLTHRKTGLYSAMFIAAAIADAFIAQSWNEIFETALQYIPQKSRFFAQMNEALKIVKQSSSFEDGYKLLNDKFSEYTAGQIVQEVGQIMNTLKYARTIEEGIALQVAQGNDTDSFGCTCGSILGVYFGNGIKSDWVTPFNDKLHTTMGNFYDDKLSSVTNRMKKLHLLIEG